MGDYNSGKFYNTIDETGIFYNNAPYVVILKLSERISFKDSLTNFFTKSVLRETVSILEEEKQKAEIKQNISVIFSEKTGVNVAMEIFEKLGIKDEMTSLLAQAYLKEDFSIIEEFKQLTEILVKENIKIKEDKDLYNFLALSDKLGTKDYFPRVYSLMKLYDTFNVSDRQPKTAISDFIVGATEDYDTAYDWLIPFGLKIDWSKTSMPSMPEAELTTVEIPSVDGSIVEDTVYKDRMFQIVAYTEQGLNKAEKQQIKAKIARILDTTKKKAKKLTIQNSNTSFDVRYDGQATITEGASYVKASIPFRTSPYGYSTFEEEMFGNGVIKNGGDMDICPVTTISGYCRNPYFEINGVSYYYSNTIEAGGKLVIDHAMKSAYVIDSSGNKSNAMKDLHTNEFAKIPVGSSAWVYAEDNATARQMLHTWRNRVLW